MHFLNEITLIKQIRFCFYWRLYISYYIIISTVVVFMFFLNPLIFYVFMCVSVAILCTIILCYII